MKHYLRISLSTLAALAIGALLALSSAGAENVKKKLISVTADDVAAMGECGEDFILVDSRGGKYFDGEMIEGAVNLPADQTDEQSLAKIIPSKDTKVVFYCTNTACNASATAAHKAMELGYNRVYKYPGGIEEWKQKGLPTHKM